VPLTIVLVAYPLAPVSPDAVGGAEQIVSLLDARLVARGHRVIVVAREGSRCRGELVATPAAGGPLDEPAIAAAHARTRAALEAVIARERVDVVHLHAIGFERHLPAPGLPVIVTLHLAPSSYPREIFALDRPRTELVCVSAWQRARCPETRLPVGVVPNGVDLEALRPAARRRGFALALGRVCPEKGFDRALDAAARAGVPIVLGGEVYPYEAHVRHFAEAIAPRLGPGARFAGPIGLARKRRLLGAARCLVAPSLVEETSSLVAMEAAASGTPVIAARRGALVEVVRDGVTGLFADDDDELARAIARATAIDPRACRREAEARFSADAMVDAYVGRYEAVARRPSMAPSIDLDEVRGLGALEAMAEAWSSLASASPSAGPFQRPEWLLAWARHAPRGEPFAIVARRAGRVVALLPAAWLVDGARARVELLGAGPSDELDAIVAHDAPRGIGARLVEALAGRADELDLGPLRAGSPLLEGPAPAGAADVVAPDAPCPTLALVGEGGLELAPKGMRRNARRYPERAARAGARVVVADDAAAVGELVAALARLHGLRWAARGGDGVLADAATTRALAEASRGLAAAGVLRLRALELRGALVAVLLGFLHRGRAACWLSGFDPAHASLSPVTVLVAHAAAEAAREGARTLDFLRGDEAYKYLWGARDVPTYRRRITR
jgi:CelD/BcsL family acetyltransferase involved in cellulose biosynthesis/glycosyltransferase involved in cell wall biosynthesis